MIKLKISDVPDHLCTHCSQCWMGECRAHTAPHSEAERIKREGGELACSGEAEEERRQEPHDVLVLRGEEFYDG